MARLDRLVDPADAWGGGENASSYERGRPSYPPAAVEHLARVLDIGPGRTVVDLGAGTGKFTRLSLAPARRCRGRAAGRDARRVASAVVGAAAFGSRCVEGGAESIPLPDASVDVVSAATAFHWFDHEVAMPEIARVPARRWRPRARLE